MTSTALPSTAIRTSLLTAGIVSAAAALLVVAPSATASPPPGRGPDGLADVRAATAKYHSEHRALADGYLRTDECVPGMGYHYLNLQLFGAPVDPLKPAALLYAPHGKGDRKLIGVEYFVVDDDQDPATHNAEVPALFGTTFDGPMPGHSDDMPVHYDLHAYVWTTNPDGVLATWNPEITCPGT